MPRSGLVIVNHVINALRCIRFKGVGAAAVLDGGAKLDLSGGFDDVEILSFNLTSTCLPCPCKGGSISTVVF
jgi:hypothetical protein